MADSTITATVRVDTTEVKAVLAEMEHLTERLATQLEELNARPEFHQANVVPFARLGLLTTVALATAAVASSERIVSRRALLGLSLVKP